LHLRPLVWEYFFTSITPLQRGFAAFCAENVLLLAYFLIRVGSRGDVEWIKAKKREPLRFIRDAYRAGCALRERRYRMLLTRPSTPFARVCQAEVRPATRRSPRHRIKCNSRINEGSKCVG